METKIIETLDIKIRGLLEKVTVVILKSLVTISYGTWKKSTW